MLWVNFRGSKCTILLLFFPQTYVVKWMQTKSCLRLHLLLLGLRPTSRRHRGWSRWAFGRIRIGITCVGEPSLARMLSWLPRTARKTCALLHFFKDTVQLQQPWLWLLQGDIVKWMSGRTWFERDMVRLQFEDMVRSDCTWGHGSIGKNA